MLYLACSRSAENARQSPRTHAEEERDVERVGSRGQGTDVL